MAYVIFDEVIARYPILETWGKSQTEVNSDLIYYSEIELNSRLGSKFTVPFSGPPPTIKDLTIDLCYCKALRTKDPDKAVKVCQMVSERIDDILNGTASICTGSGTIIEVSGADQEVWSSNLDYYPTHSMLDPESKYTQIDPDLLDDLEDERG